MLTMAWRTSFNSIADGLPLALQKRYFLANLVSMNNKRTSVSTALHREKNICAGCITFPALSL
jgi:hypothetical protein